MDPLNVKQALRALVANTPREPAPVMEPERDPVEKLGNRIQADIVKEAPPGLLGRAGSTAASGLSAVGNLLDVPGSMARDVLTWLPGGPKPANPFDQLLSPFSEKNRTTGRDLNRGYGLSGKEDTGLNFTGGMATEILTDPLTYLTFGASAATKGGRAAKALGLWDKAPEVASRALGRKVGKREARHIVTPRMLLSDPKLGKADIRLALENRMRKEFGLSEADMDRQLGGLAKISLPFTDKPFSFGGKPFTWGGLTDEYGVIGAGKIRGKGRPLPSPEIEVPPPRGDEGGSGWDSVPDDPTPPPRGGGTPPAVNPVSPLPQPTSPPPGTASQLPDTSPKIPTTDVIQPSIPKATIRQSTESASDYIIDLLGDNPARALLRYAGESDEHPMIFLDEFVRQPKATRGTGRAMIDQILDATKDRDPSSITGAFDDNASLGSFAAKFGKDNLVFRDRKTGEVADVTFDEVKADPKNYSVTHYLKPEFKPKIIGKATATGKPKSGFDYTPSEQKALSELGYSDEAEVSYLADTAKEYNTNPARLLTIDSAVSNLVDMVSKEGFPLIQALDNIEGSVNLELDRLGLQDASLKEIEYAKKYASLIDRPLTLDDLVQYGKQRVADARKGTQKQEAERIFKKFGRFDLDENAYYRAVLGDAPKPKQQKSLIGETDGTATNAPGVTASSEIPQVKLNEPFIHNDRVMVITDVNGVKVPYYLSTGEGGKKSVATGKWYPFFGVGKDKWINKGSEKNINEFYGSPSLKAKADELNNSLGSKYKASQKDLPVAFGSTTKVSGDRRYVTANVNEGFSPVNWQDTVDNRQLHDANISNAIARIEGKASTASIAETKPTQTATDAPTTSADDFALTNKKAKSEKLSSYNALDALLREDPELYQRWKDGEVEELSRYTNNPEHDDIYFQWTDAGLEHPWPSLVKGDEKVWDEFRYIPQNIAPDISMDSVTPFKKAKELGGEKARTYKSLGDGIHESSDRRVVITKVASNRWDLAIDGRSVDEYASLKAAKNQAEFHINKPQSESSLDFSSIDEVGSKTKQENSKVEKPVVVSGQAKDLIDQSSGKADDTVAPAVDKAKIDRINGWVRFLENAVEPNTQRPKYSSKEIDIARQIGYGDIENALAEERQLKARNATPRISVMKFIQSAVTNKVLPETALDEAKQIARRFVVNEQLPNIKTDTAAKAEMIATREIFSELSQQDKALFTGSKDFGKQVGESYKDVLAKTAANKNNNSGQKLESRVDLNTLDGLPDEAKPIVGSMISKIGTRLFDDVQVQMGGMGRTPDVGGNIDMNTGFINIYDAAIKRGLVDKTLVHELWHHLSKYLPIEEVRLVQNEYDNTLVAYRKKNSGQLPYELSNLDEYFAHKLTELTKKYLGREKPVTLIGKTWAKALDVFEYIWDAMRQTLGYDQTKAIMKKFLAGKKSNAVKVSDLAMEFRIEDDLIESAIRESRLDNQTKSIAFKNWFGDWEKDPKNASKVVDVEGKPLVVYHGTDAEDFNAFDIPENGVAYFTPRTDYSYIQKSNRVYPAYISIKNPFYTERSSLIEQLRSNPEIVAELKSKGHDGVIYSKNDNLMKGPSGWGDDRPQMAVFDETQIKSATGNRGTFDPTSKNILESQADPLLSSKEVADQLSEFRSAKIGKGLDTAAQTVLDSALGRSLTALFDQSVLGQLSKAGQEAARLAFTGYRESVYRERLYMSKFLRTWYETPNIREDEIINNELKSLDDYISGSSGNKRDAKIAQLADARRIQNSRINDIRRLQERSMRDEDGNISQALIVVTPDQLPAWVGQEMNGKQLVANPARRQELANLITSFRYKTLNMIREENANGIMTTAVDGYSPRVLSVMPTNPLISWNPNFGKLIDVTHPHQRRRDDYLTGYDDGTSVINDISVDPEFSGIHAKKKVKQKPTEADIKQTARQLWLKYRGRLKADKSGLTYDQLIQQDDVLAKRVSDLAHKMMELSPDHAKYQIPLFSNDLFSAFELRLEHHYRSIAHAKVVQNLLGESTTIERLLPRDSDGTVLANVLDKAKYNGELAIKKILGKIPKNVILEADKEFWDTKVLKRIKNIKEAYDTALEVDPKKRKKLVDLNGGPVTWNAPEGKATFTNIIPTKNNNKQFDIEITYNDSNPNQSTVRIVENVRDGDDWQPIYHDIQDPTNATVDAYESTIPVDVMLQNLVVPQEVADAVNKFVRGPKPLDEVKPLIQGYDKLTNMWKMMQTGMLPFLSFHTRNLGSGLASNLYLGTQLDPRFSEFNLADPGTYINPIRSISAPVVDAHRIATGQTIPGISKAPIFANKNLTDEQATEELRKIIYANAIVGEKQGISAEQLMDTVGTAATQYPGIDGARSVNPLRGKFSQSVPESTFAQRWFMPWMSKGVLSDKDIFRPGQLGRDLGQYTESLNRLSPFISMIRRGYDPQAAAALVNKAQVDYTMLSNFEREYMRRMFPFYSYTRGVTPFVYGQLMERPAGAMGRQIIATTRAGQTDEQGVTPDYIRETASIPLGPSEDGTRSYITGFGLPFEDPLQFAQLLRGNVSGTLRELGSRLNPVPKSIVETTTGRSLYQAGPFGGREIEDLDPTIGRIRANISDLMTGEKTERAQPFLDSPWLEYAIANSGLGRSLNTIRTATDPRKYDTIPWKLLLNLGTGVRVADVSPSAQDAILRERLARVMKDFGGRMYTRPYFPDYAQENWTPEQAADAAQIEALMKLLNQRATDRKRMEAAQ